MSSILPTGGLSRKRQVWLGVLGFHLSVFFLCSTQGGAVPLQLSLWNPIQLYCDESDVAGLRLNLVYGSNRNLYGLDVGLINHVARDCRGAQIGVLLNDEGFFHEQNSSGRLAGFQMSLAMNGAKDVKGLQVAGLANLVSGDMVGVQLGWLFGNACLGNGCGAQVGLANITLKKMNGVQLAGAFILAANIAETVQGVQVSAAAVSLNKSDRISGLQLNVGLIGNYAVEVKGAQIAATCNLADHVGGVQVGLVNYCRSIAGLQIGAVNIIADGGLPVFPVVNARF